MLNKIDVLNQYKNLCIELEVLKEIKVNSLITLSDNEDVKQAKNKFTVMLDKIINKRTLEQRNILTAITNIKNPLYKSILYERYINGLMWFQIAMKLHYSDKYIIKELFPKALEEIKYF